MTNLVEVNNEQVVTTSIMVAETFGKRHDNVLQAIKNLEKDVLNFKEMFSEGETPDKYGRPRKTYFMNKDGFTLLVMGFNGKEALQFKLQYIEAFNKMEEHIKKGISPSYLIEDPITRAEQWILEQKEKRALEHTVTQYEPKVQYYHKVLQPDNNLMTVTQIAKDYGMHAMALNKLLHELKIQFKHNNQWLLYSEYQNKGYTKSVTSLDPSGKSGTEGAVHVYTKWTQKGRKFIHDTLAKKGIMPID